MQVDAVPWSQASIDELDPGSGSTLNEERFLIRRARLRTDFAKRSWRGGLEIDGNTINGASLRLLSAEIKWEQAIPDGLVHLRSGLFKPPFAADLPAKDRERYFLEPARATTAFFPGGYDAGLEASLRWRILRATFAAMNGAPAQDAQFRGRDPSSSFEWIGRIGVDIDGVGWQVQSGISGLTGRGLSPGVLPTKDELVWVDENQNGLVETTELRVVPGDPGTASASFSRRALAADLRVGWWLPWAGRGEAQAEIIAATNLDRGLLPADPVVESRDLRELGWHAAVVQSVTRHAFVGARLDQYRPDRDQRDRLGSELVQVDPTWTTATAIAGYRFPSGRITAEVRHERNPLGRGDDGQRTTRADDRVTVRAQVEY